MKKVKKEKAGSSKGYLIAGVIALMLAIIIYGLMVVAEDTVLSKYANTEYIAFNQPIKAGTYVADNTMFKIVRLDQTQVPENIIGKLDDVIGKYLTTDVYENTLATTNLFEERVDGVDGNKILSIAVDGSLSAVNGMIRAGDRVDMYWISPNYGEIVKEQTITMDGVTWVEKSFSYDQLEPTYKNVYILEARNADGLRVDGMDKDSMATVFTLQTDETMANEIETMMSLGYALRMVKCNE